MMRSLLAKYAPVAMLSALGVLAVTSIDVPLHAMSAGGTCEAPHEASQRQMTEDERVYYIGCGGLY